MNIIAQYMIKQIR